MASPAKEWPALEWESTAWESSLPLDAMPRAARRRHSGPYMSAIAPRISGLDPALSAEVQSLVDQATAEISRFDSEVGSIVAPFASILLRTESASSSQIENLTAGARAIALAEIDESRKANARINVANVRAMRAAVELADRLELDSILQMHRALLEGDDPSGAGHLRDGQVWIGGSDYGPHGAEFVPPRAALVPGAMSDLVEFMARDDLPVLTQAAIAHAQFETIHPFFDGNGRTGRALVHSILTAKGLVREVTVPISAGLLTNTDAYFGALDRYREGRPEAIVERFAAASIMAIANGRELVADLREIRAGWSEKIPARRDAVAWRLADLLLRQPVVNAQFVQEELGATSANAHRALRQLASAEVLTEVTGRKRNRLWQAREVIEALDAFAERSRRRRPV